MVSRPFRDDCDESRLISFLDDGLPEPENARLTEHLDRCAHCRHTLERLAAGNLLWDELRQLSPASDHSALPTDTVGRSPRGGSRSEGDPPLDFLGPPDGPGSLGRLGPYEVTEVLGRGGFGVVLKAFDPALSRAVAIKVLAPHFAASAAARTRFAREARAAAAVVHENVVAIHAVDSWNGLPYLVMPCVAGRSLQERVDRDGPLAVKEVLRIGMQAAQGLAAAHEQGLVHRDIKPSNILLENSVERVKLSDFGLARAVDDASLTRSGVVAGTPQYMSPEQANGEPVDHRSDLFSLGSVLYFMCAGRPPFRADSTLAVLRRVCDDQPRPLREVNSEIPDWLAEVVERLHAKDPAERFSTAAEVAEVLTYHLAELQRTGTSSSLRPTPSAPLPKAPGRKRAAAATVLTLAVLGASAVSGMPGRIFALLPPGDDRTPTVARSPASGGHVVVQDAGGRSLENPIIGSGRPSVKVWDVADFNAVKIGSTFRAEITRGDRFKVTTSSDDNVVEHIQVVKEGKTLRIGLEQGSYRLNEPLKAVITLPTLEALDVGGASGATLKGFRSQGDFKLNLSGASTLDGMTEVGDADFLVSGASTLALSGTARASHVWVSGASHLKLPEFLMKQCEIGLSGASTVVLSVRSEQPFWATLSGASTLAGTVDAGDFELELEGASRATLGGSAKDAKVKADGASHVDMAKLSLDAGTVTLTVGSASTVALQGKAEAATIVASDSGTLRLADLAVDDADVKLSGVSRAAVRVRKRLKYDLSAQSRLDYSGNPPTLLGSKSKEATLRPRP